MSSVPNFPGHFLINFVVLGSHLLPYPSSIVYTSIYEGFRRNSRTLRG